MPALQAITTSTSNVFPETSLVGQLEAGQLDAGFFYGVEAAAADIKTVPLTGTDLAGHYTITVLNRAPHEAAARAFLAFLLGKEGRKILSENGIGSITPPKVSDSSSVPKTLRDSSHGDEGGVHSPLPWLGGLIVVYLSVPLVAFAIRFLGASPRLPRPWAVPVARVSLESATFRSR